MRLLNTIFRLFQVNKKNWKPVVLCILAATIFWFLNSLNENYTTSLSFPLEFRYNSEEYIPVEPLPSRLNVNVTGMGWDLFRRSVGLKVSPLVIPLERPSTVKKIVGTTLPALFSEQLEGLQINFVVNDTIYVNIEPKARRWVSVDLDSLDRYIRPGYGITSAVTITPDSVLLEGPESMIAELTGPIRLELDQQNLNDDYDDEVNVLSEDQELITATPSTVLVTFTVEEFVELTDSVRLVLVNLPESAQPELRVEKLPVTLRLPRSHASHVPWDSIRAVVDLKGFERGSIKTEPRIAGLPSGVELVEIDSVSITY